MNKRTQAKFATAIEKALKAAMREEDIDCPVCAVANEYPPIFCPDCPIHVPCHERAGDAIRGHWKSRPLWIRRVRSIIRRLRAGTWKP